MSAFSLPLPIYLTSLSPPSIPLSHCPSTLATDRALFFQLLQVVCGATSMSACVSYVLRLCSVSVTAVYVLQQVSLGTRALLSSHSIVLAHHYLDALNIE